MTLKAKTIKTKGNFVEQPLLGIDNYPARVVQVIDLGLQDGGEYKGEKKPPVNKLYVTYELVDAFCVDEAGNELEDKPRWVSEELNMFPPQADKAKCNQRYKAIDPDEVHDYDWAQLVGSSCVVTIVHKESKGKVYANIGSVTPYIVSKRNPELVELVNPSKVFDVSEPDLEVLGALPEWLQVKIKGNLEFKGSKLEAALNGEDQPEGQEDEQEEEPTGKEPW